MEYAFGVRKCVTQMASQLMYFSFVSSVFVLNRFIFVLDFWLIAIDMVLSLKGELNTWVCIMTFWPKKVGLGDINGPGCLY